MKDAEQWWFLFGYPDENKHYENKPAGAGKGQFSRIPALNCVRRNNSNNSHLRILYLLGEPDINTLHDDLFNSAVK